MFLKRDAILYNFYTISLEASSHLLPNNHLIDAADVVPRQSCVFSIQDVAGSSQKSWGVQPPALLASELLGFGR